MKTEFSDRVERGRATTGPQSSCRGDNFGAFELRMNNGVSHANTFVAPLSCRSSM